MRREVLLDEIEKLYSSNDMVKADCGGCEGCSVCCHGMGNSVVLDPYDIWRLTAGLSVNFAEILDKWAELHVDDGLVLPNLRMNGKEEGCTFLDEKGRCKIHAFRPGLCRLFPLGRYYEGDSFRYYLQLHQCPKANRTKIKVKKWIDTPDIGKNEQFILDWHFFQKELQRYFKEAEDGKLVKDVNTYMLNLFYGEPYDTAEDFYGQFYDRLKKAKKLMAAIEW